MPRLPALMLLLLLIGGCGPAPHYFAPGPQGVGVFLHLPDAREVLFASSRDGFLWHDARRNGQGEWWVTVPGRGEFKYFFKVDGAVYLPRCSSREYDDFGQETCIYQE